MTRDLTSQRLRAPAPSVVMSSLVVLCFEKACDSDGKCSQVLCELVITRLHPILLGEWRTHRASLVLKHVRLPFDHSMTRISYIHKVPVKESFVDLLMLKLRDRSRILVVRGLMGRLRSSITSCFLRRRQTVGVCFICTERSDVPVLCVDNMTLGRAYN
jgi:hypothetical protein